MKKIDSLIYQVLNISPYYSGPITPHVIMIDTCTSCQLRCPRCPVTTMSYEDNVKRGYLTFNSFKKIVDSNPKLTTVIIDNFGEFFLNPDLTHILRYAYENRVTTKCDVGVNLNNASKEALESIVKYRLRSLNCSIDGASQETYEKYRVGGNFDAVISNIKTINAFKKKYSSKNPRLTWQFIVFGHNEHEIATARKMAEELDMIFYPKISWDKDFSPIKNEDEVLRQTGWKYITREDQEEDKGVSFSREVCYTLWYSPRINWDGTINGCCWNTWSDFGGNAINDFKMAMNSEKISYARKMLLNKAPERSDIPCVECKIYKKMKDSHNYLSRREIMQYKSVKYHLHNILFNLPALGRLFAESHKGKKLPR